MEVDLAEDSSLSGLDFEEISRTGRCDLTNRGLTALPPEILGLRGLEVLDLTGNHLTALPREIALLTGLRELRLRANQLHSLPPEVAALANLEILDLSDNQFIVWPPEIAQLTGLQVLVLRWNRLAALPSGLAMLTNLRKLDLLDNQITVVPPQIAELTRLEVLNLGGNPFADLPPEISQLTGLQVLDLSGSRLGRVPLEITQLTGLHELSLAACQLRSVPPEIARLASLRSLDLSLNQLAAVPPEIASLASLRELVLHQNQITRFPAEISYLECLEILDASGNQLDSVPPEIGQLAALRELRLDGNRISAVPPEIGQLAGLRELRLGRNQLTTVPPEIMALTALEVLDLSGNQLGAAPPGMGHLVALRELWLGGNQLAAIPAEIGGLAALEALDLGANHFRVFPLEVGRLTSLQVLWLDGNEIESLPPELFGLTGLRKLWLGGQRTAAIGDRSQTWQAPARLAYEASGVVSYRGNEFSGNQLAEIPPEISQLESLETLGLGANRIMCVPPEIERLAALKTLDLGRNQLTALPDEIGKLARLRTLNLDHNQLAAMPAALTRLTALETLDLSGNQLAAVPDDIGRMIHLHTLSLDDNRLSSLPAGIGQLTRLRRLDLAANQLSSLPAEICELVRLRIFPVNNNHLAEIPPGIGRMASLVLLDVRGNRLTTLPWQLAQRIEAGLNLRIDGNPFSGPVVELLERGPLILAGYLRSLEHGIPQYEAKLLLVGEGEVGKTSLVAALRGDPFAEGRPTTHGIEVRPVDLPHPHRDVTLSMRAWDFGGQEVYRVSHQFFFSENALYLVVWKPRAGQEQNEVEGWLRRIRLRVRDDARVLIVATHGAGTRHPDLDYPSLKRAFPVLLADQFEVDNETGQGITQLRQAIAAEAAALPQMGQLLSPQWIAAREAILALARSEPQITYDRFEEICRSHGVGPDEAPALAALLHVLGRIVYYGDDDGLRDFVVLNPEWLTKAISYVLEDIRTRQAGGILDHTQLRQIWQNPPDGAGYPYRYHPYFLRLMEKFDISYRLEDDAYRSLVAQLTPYTRPSLPWDAQAGPPDGLRRLALICRLSEPVPGLISWLTVRHHRASTGLHWRSGVFLRHPIATYASEALIELTAPDLLTIEVRAPSPDYFFSVLRDSVEDLMTRRWPGLSYELLIPCPATTKDGDQCPAGIPMDDLRVYREEGETRYLCARCRTRHDISTLLTGFPGQQLAPELNRLHAGITQLKDEIASLSSAAAETAGLVRKVLHAVSTEITDCPRLFTLTSRDPVGIDRLKPGQKYYRLVLWCEHPGHWHPWPAATYNISQPTDWLIRVAPAATIIFKILQLAAPIASAAAGLALTPRQMQDAQNEIQLATALINALPTSSIQQVPEPETAQPGGQLTPAQGQAWRIARVLIFEHDPARAFGDLRRVQAPSGEFLWVCPHHYAYYDPGLPVIPNDQPTQLRVMD